MLSARLCSVLVQNLHNFVSLKLKLQNLCCHIEDDNSYTGYLIAKWVKKIGSGEDVCLTFFWYKRSYVFLRNTRNTIFCLSNQFLLNQCCTTSVVQFAKKSLNVLTVKQFSNILFAIFCEFSIFLWLKGTTKGQLISKF